MLSTHRARSHPSLREQECAQGDSGARAHDGGEGLVRWYVRSGRPGLVLAHNHEVSAAHVPPPPTLAATQPFEEEAAPAEPALRLLPPRTITPSKFRRAQSEPIAPRSRASGLVHNRKTTRARRWVVPGRAPATISIAAPSDIPTVESDAAAQDQANPTKLAEPTSDTFPCLPIDEAKEEEEEFAVEDSLDSALDVPLEATDDDVVDWEARLLALAVST